MDAEIEAELRSHIEMAEEEAADKGMSEDEARRRVRLRFGNPVVIQERVTEADAAVGAEGIYADIGYALRQLRRSPAFSLAAIATLALGIGASTAIFSLVRAFVLRPLPYPHAERLVVVWERLRVFGIERFPATIADFLDYKHDNHVFDEMTAVENAHYVLQVGDYPERIFGLRATANLFPMLGLHAVMGRTLTDEDNLPGHQHVAVLSYAIWRQRFGSDQRIVGKNIVLDGENYEVVGVLGSQARFSVGYPESPAVWTALPLGPDPARNTGQLEMLARLREGITLRQAQAQMDSLASALEREYHIERGPHGEDPGYAVRLVPLHEELTGGIREPLLLMLGATALIFLIACANIANLMLSHGAMRAQEFAIRISLGASRARLMRLMLVQAGVVALLGTAAALGVAAVLSELLVRLSPYRIAKLFGTYLDFQVLAWAVALAVVAVLLFGLMPSIGIYRRSGSMISPATAHHVIGDRSGSRTGRMLVAAEVALSVALTIGAGILIHSFLRIEQVPLGFTPQGMVTARLTLPPSYASPVLQRQFDEELLQRLGSTPGVQQAAATTMLPAADRPLHDPFSIEGRPWQPFGAEHVPQFMNHQAVSIEYFRTMEIPLRAGRVFRAEDRADSQSVAIVNEAMVRGFWPGESPLGKRVMAGAPRPDAPWLTIVGVVSDVKSGGATADALPELYTPLAQTPSSTIAIVMRTRGDDPAQGVNQLRSAVESVDRSIPLDNVATYDELLASEFAPRRYEMFLLTAFGALSLALAAVGLYGVVSYAVSQRTREIALRMALGATAGNVTRMVLGQALTLAGYGLAAGVGLAFLGRHVLASAIFGIRALDIPTYAAVSLLLLATTFAAAYLPARRAVGVDPMRALRSE